MLQTKLICEVLYSNTESASTAQLKGLYYSHHGVVKEPIYIQADYRVLFYVYYNKENKWNTQSVSSQGNNRIILTSLLFAYYGN